MTLGTRSKECSAIHLAEFAGLVLSLAVAAGHVHDSLGVVLYMHSKG